MRKLTLKSNTYSGKLIVFEGTDGAGKTTMIGLTRQLLEEKYGEEQVISVKQPTDMSRKTKLFQKMMYSRNHEEIDYLVALHAVLRTQKGLFPRRESDNRQTRSRAV